MLEVKRKLMGSARRTLALSSCHAELKLNSNDVGNGGQRGCWKEIKLGGLIHTQKTLDKLAVQTR